MGTAPAHPPHRDEPSTLARVVESFWAIDVLVLSVLAFFIIVGGATSTPVLIVGCVLALLYAAHAVRRHNRRDAERSADARRMRERRGF